MVHAVVIFLLIVFPTETKLTAAVYSSICVSQFNPQRSRIKVCCFFKSSSAPTAIINNSVSLPWVNNRDGNIQTALNKHILAQKPENSKHTSNIQTCRRSFQYETEPELQTVVTLHALFLFWRGVNCCFGCVISADLTIGFNMAVFGSIRSS